MSGNRWAIALIVSVALVPPDAIGAQLLVSSRDSVVTLELPDGFQPVIVNAVAQLQYADTAKSAFFLVISESKQDLFGWNLTRHATITLAQVVAATDLPEVSDRVSTSIGPRPAVQYEIRGAVQGTQLVYLHTTVDGPGHFVQVLGWTPRSQWASAESDLRAIVESVRVGAAAPPDRSTARSLVPGTWAWMSDENGCEGKTQTFEISDDGTRMTILHKEPFEGPDGSMRSETQYVVEASSPTVLNTFIVDEHRLTDSGEPVKWDLVVVARNQLAWHRTDWQDGALTDALMRCAD